LLLFILVPAIELVLLIQIGQRIGVLPTIGLIFLTGAAGAYLVRRQGLQVWNRIRGDFQAGQLPADALLDGAIILVAGGLLLTPGILTDTMGLLCLIPASRRVIKRVIWSRLERMAQKGQIFGSSFQRLRRQGRPEDVIILDSEDYRSSEGGKSGE
jgi:UPF0716 protein FxsA